jgi:RNA polymerase primary sigma factor
LVQAIEETASSRNALATQLRYGLIDGSARTLQSVGDEVGITRERVRQVVERVIPASIDAPMKDMRSTWPG